MERLLLVFVAGGIGACTRYLFVSWTQRMFGEAFPWGVFGVNVVGSFLIALIGVLAVTKAGLTETMRVTLMTGFLGGLTTYSSFNQDTLAMFDKKLYGTALLYIAVTLIVCMGAGVLGIVTAKRF